MKQHALNLLFLLLTGAALYAAPLNVRDFGAKGDGITDDTDAIQLALNEVERLSKKDRSVYATDHGRIAGWGIFDGPNRELFFPAGRYRISRTLVGGHAVTLSGEKGSIIFTEDSNLLILYLNRLFRGSIRHLTFRGGKTHVLFWTANQDVASLVIEDCSFENSTGYALDSGNYSLTEGGKFTPVGPFAVTWNDRQMPSISPQKWNGTMPNSTKYVLTRSTFTNCAGASNIRTDGSYISECSFTSSLPQKLTPFICTWTSALYNCRISLNIPEDFRSAFIADAGWVENVTALSSTKYGAPLMVRNKEFNRGIYDHPDSIVIKNCVSASANSFCNAIFRCPKARPVQFSMSNVREASGSSVKAVHFDHVPKNDQDLLLDQHKHANHNIPRADVGDSHSYMFTGNGKEIKINLPPIMRQFLASDTLAEYRKKFPETGAAIPPADTSECEIFDALDYGISFTPGNEDQKNLQKLFDAAAQSANPMVILPGRRFDLTEPLVIPPKCVIKAEGRSVLYAAETSKSIFKVRGSSIALDVTGIIFSGGTDAIELKGAGNARFNDCLFYDNRTTFLLVQTAEKRLCVEAFASSAYTPVLVDNHGAEFRLNDSWLSIQATLDNGACMINRKNGIILAQNIVGVPVLFGPWMPGRENWKYSRNVYWVENHGVFRSKHFRYGVEFDGAPLFDNYGSGRILFEGAVLGYWNRGSSRVLLRNESCNGEFGMASVASYGAIDPAASAFYEGTMPGIFLIANYPHPKYIILRK